MLLQQLYIERLRNLQSVALKNLQPFNVFYGLNGSGKTSILEAIHLLATGRSFRTHIPKHYIQHQQQDTLIFAKSYDYQIGLQKLISGEQFMKVNGDHVATQGQMAKLLPVQVIEPQSTDIIDQGAKFRRQLLDWMMFHVEPEFFPLWQSYSRSLKQRNSLLKRYPINPEQISALDHLLVDAGEKINLLRELAIAKWQPLIQQELTALLPDIDVELDYFSGFSTSIGFGEQLKKELKKDIEKRSTQHGVHRADFRLKTSIGYADDVLSRGQKKMLIIALKLAQITLLHRSNRETVVLLDDLTAELDSAAQLRLIRRLQELESQVFLTTLDQQSVQCCIDQVNFSYQLYAVDTGHISPVERQLSSHP